MEVRKPAEIFRASVRMSIAMFSHISMHPDHIAFELYCLSTIIHMNHVAKREIPACRLKNRAASRTKWVD